MHPHRRELPQKKSGKKRPTQVSPSLPRANRESVPNQKVNKTVSSEQHPVSNIVKSPNENYIKPAAAKTKGGEEPGKPADSSGSEGPADKSGERPADAEPLPPAGDRKGTNASPESLTSLPDQIEATPSGSERVRLQLKLAEQLVAAGKKTEATKELRAIINANVFDPQVLYNAGNALARVGDSDEAINAYRKAIDQRKGNYSRALNNLGVILLRQGRWDEAHEALSSALKLENFHYAEASYNLGRLYSARGEGDLAIREWRRSLRIDPEHLAAAQALSVGARPAVIVVRSGTSGRPEPHVKTSRAPSTPTTATPLALDAVSYDFLQRARNSRELGQHKQAIEDYQRVLLRLHGYFPPANLEISYALLALIEPTRPLRRFSR